MKYVEKSKIELSDILLPDLFVSNYMMGLEEHALKLYLYMKFMAKNKIDIKEEQIAKKLGISKVEYEKAMKQLETEELVVKLEDGYSFVDIKEQELNEIPIYAEYSNNLEVVNNMINLVKDELNDYFYHVLND